MLAPSPAAQAAAPAEKTSSPGPAGSSEPAPPSKSAGSEPMAPAAVKKNEDKLVSSKAELESLTREAAARGVTDLDAALELANQTAPRAGAAASDLSRLVEADVKLRSLDGIILHKEGIALLMPGNVGIHVARQGDPATKQRLQTLINRLHKKLIKDGKLPRSYENGLPENSPEYAQGLVEVREDVVRSLRFQVECQVAKRCHLLRALEQAEGSKNAVKNRKGLKRCATNIANLMRMLPAWEVYGTDQSTALEATEEVIRAAYDGKFPWSNEVHGSGATEVVRRHFGVLYRTAKAQVARAEEESGYLKMEVVRLFNGLDCRINAVSVHVEQLSQLVEAPRSVAEANGASTNEADALAGRRLLASLEHERLVIIREVAQEKLAKYMPVAA